MTPTHTPSAKETVLAWVRSKNPQTMELKTGCKVEYDYNGRIHVGTIGAQSYEQTDSKSVMRKHGCNDGCDYMTIWNFCLIEDDFPYVAPQEHCDKYKDVFRFTHPITTILGSDMGLQELCISFDAKGFDWNMRILDGIAYFEEVSFEEVYVPEVKYDLTQNLHQQSEEFYEGILPLIPND